jgi:uncharacterized protein
MSNKKTLVLGASPNPSRYSNIATLRLLQYGHEVIPLGIRKGDIGLLPIELEAKNWEDVDTLTLYMNPKRQVPYYDYIVNNIAPKRIIFNPGTENEELRNLAAEKGIETDYACTLVLLSTGQY